MIFFQQDNLSHETSGGHVITACCNYAPFKRAVQFMSWPFSFRYSFIFLTFCLYILYYTIVVIDRNCIIKLLAPKNSYLAFVNKEIYQIPWQQGLIIVNPFHPTGPFLAPKLIITIKYLIYFLFSKVLVWLFLHRTRCEFYPAIALDQVLKNKIKKLKNIK